jgi:propionate CoA-transferase
MSKVISATSATALIKDGATVATTCLGLAGWPEELAIAMEKGFLAAGHPAKLTFVHTAAIGDWGKVKGAAHFIHPGMIQRCIFGHVGLCPDFAAMLLAGGCEAYNFPMGVVSQLWRGIAAHQPGVITKTGLGTFADPRLEGGKINKITTKDIIKVISLEGEEWLLYKGFPIDVAIFRGTTADENGNLAVEDEGMLFEILSLAQAAKNSGGIVIAEVANLAQAGSLNPRTITVPGVLVDHLVISAPENHWQSAGTKYNPAFSGMLRVPLAGLPPMPLNERLIIARRAAMELTPGCNVNLGIGVPGGIADVAAEEGVSDLITLTSESGTIGGLPAGGHDFGLSRDADAYVEMASQFDWYSGGGVDVAFEGAAEVDAKGNVNVSKFNGMFVGCGGFIDITQHAGKVVYCGTFTAGGLKISIAAGKLAIDHEGKVKKYIGAVEQVTFSGAYATKMKQPVLFITERAVFELQDGQLALVEVAPGIDIERDILAHMDFKPLITGKPKSMPAEIFQPKWGRLRAILNAKHPGADKPILAAA